MEPPPTTNSWVVLDGKNLPCQGGYMDLGQNAVSADALPFTDVPNIGILWAEEWAELLRMPSWPELLISSPVLILHPCKLIYCQ